MKKIITSLVAAVSIAGLLALSAPAHAISYYFEVENGPGGTITSSVGGVNCSSGNTCDSSSLPEGTSVTLSASPGSGKLFSKWGGVCSGTSATCNITMTSAWRITATWIYKTVPLSVKFSGSGSGSVSISSGGGTCSGNCTRNISHTVSSVNLTAVPASGSKFAGWDYQNGANSCYSGGGKGGGAYVNTSSTCTRSLYFTVYDGGPITYTAVPIFNKTSGSSTSSGSGSSSGSTSASGSDSATTTKDGKPKVPTVSTIKVAGKKVSTKEHISLKSDEPLVLSGKTIPNGIVKLTIHSTPKTVTTKADKKGDWSYTITGLEPGNHYVEASVKDPKTKKSSKEKKLISFAITAATSTDSGAGNTSTAAVAAASKSGSKVWLIAVPIIMAAAGAGGWYGWRRWKAGKAGKSGDVPPASAAPPSVPLST